VFGEGAASSDKHGSKLATGKPSRVTTAVTGSHQAEVVAASATATGEPSHIMTAVTGPQQAQAATTSQVLVPRAPSQGRGQSCSDSRPSWDHEAAGAAADDDAPLEWGQLRGQPRSAPERAPEVLVMREDGCVLS
jgi:hypothetical protein